ncbi:MAG: hydrogenase expression/formation protein HypE [bacterium]|jgi:hydrogenase expression/formation protein HypE
MTEVIKLAHGSGGEASRRLVEDVIAVYFKNEALDPLDDSAVMAVQGGRLAFTTDSYTVDPIFFPGGDIGSLAVHGTVNDLAMVGARPVALTLGLILEEGLALSDLRRILESVRDACSEARVNVVAGDTKVVERGSADGIFINTSGIGTVPEGVNISASNAVPGDVVILSGNIGDHGIAVLSMREGMDFTTTLKSDSAPLNTMVQAMLEVTKDIHAMRDPTRGGLGTSLNEIAARSKVGIEIEEAAVPVDSQVRDACDMLGFDVFYVANEGKLVAFVPESEAAAVLDAVKAARYGGNAAVIGKVVKENPGLVTLNTQVGGRRILSPLSGELLPRIC